MTFPPDELIEYDTFSEWDTDLYTLKTSVSFNGLSDKAVLAINLMYHSLSSPITSEQTSIITTKSNKHQPLNKEAIITISHTKVTKLAAGEDYHGELL